MAFDGIVVAKLKQEFEQTIVGGKISKIAQPEADELLLTVKNNGETYKLLISASASLPFLYLSSENKPSPITAPSFCMVLRKHIANGKITEVSQLGLERIIIFTIEHLNEMGDLYHKKLIIEIMGKHSNIIFCDEDLKIIDSIKHISANISSLREVLPGRTWFLPEELTKTNPLEASEARIAETVRAKSLPLFKALYTSFAGISPLSANEIVHRCNLLEERSSKEMDELSLMHFSHIFKNVMDDISAGIFDVCVNYDGDVPSDFSAINLTMYGGSVKHFTSMSEVVESFYSVRNKQGAIKSRSSELRKTVTNLIERNVKKFDLLEKQLKDCEERENYKIYGELLTTYGYTLKGGIKEAVLNNYYTGEDVTITLDPDLSAIDNAKKYFNKYSKAKRMFEATNEQLSQTNKELSHLQSILTELTIASDENDLKIIKKELQDFGYIKKHGPEGKKGEKAPKLGKPYHYVTEDGFHIYVGRNNYQNDELTFNFADGGDYWFHAKNMPGSHVIVKSSEELPDHVFEDAGALAAFYSKGRDGEKVEVDYIQRKHVKRTPGGAPGFVIYHTNYSLIAKPQIGHLKEIK